MKSRFAFRRLLPIVQVLLFFLILVMAHAYWTVIEAEWEFERLAHPPPEGTVYRDLRSSWNGKEQIPLLAILLSLPAALVVRLVEWLLPFGTFPKPVKIALFTPAIAVLWYLVGLWLDRRLGLAPVSPKIPHRFWRYALLIALALLLSAIGLFLFWHLVDPFAWTDPIGSFLLLAWLVFGAVVIIVQVRGWWVLSKQNRLQENN
jgi:TRAP-type C4-dicarboxylate transport system permease small subunit